MNIKINARLSAYSRLATTETILPNITPDDTGKILGVIENGQIGLFDNTSSSSIDALFDSNNTSTSSDKKSDIDSLFE